MTGWKLHLDCLDLPLTRPLVISGQTLACRRVIRVTVTDSQNRTACGDIAPLPGLHEETLDQALAQVRAISEGRLPERLYPSVQMGLDMAQWQMTHEKTSGAVKLNALVWGDSLEQVDALLSQGYESLKIKVGRDTLARDIERVQEIKQRVRGRASVRLDANRTWSLDQAVAFADAVGPDQIDYIEEPTARPEDHAAFYQATRLPYAWDESLARGDVQDAEGLGALVIKPASLGSLDRVDQLVTWARSHGKQAVISSVFESNLALLFYAGYCVERGLEHTCHGLDTWRWLDHAASLTIERGRMILGAGV